MPSDVSRGGPAQGFDAQAATFDRRAGLDPSVADVVAARVVEYGDPRADHLVFELGAGTGEIGRHLSTRARRYVGTDLSLPMLGVFQSKLDAAGEGPSRRLLVQADGDRCWPVKAGTVGIIFASRVAHLLRAAHVVEESRRVCRPGACFLVGRVERTGMKKALRREREAILTRRALAGGRSGARRTEALLESFMAAGAEPLAARAVSTWTVTTTAEDVIGAWEGMPSMAGRAVDAATRAEVLGELRRWAGARYGALDRPEAATEMYVLEGVRLL